VFSLNDAEICNAIRSYEKHKASKKKKRKDLVVLAKTSRLNRFFQEHFQAAIVKAVALTRAPENEGENQDISVETTFTLSLAGYIDMFFFQCLVCNLWFLLIGLVNVVSCRVTL